MSVLFTALAFLCVYRFVIPMILVVLRNLFDDSCPHWKLAPLAFINDWDWTVSEAKKGQPASEMTYLNFMSDRVDVTAHRMYRLAHVVFPLIIMAMIRCDCRP